MPLRSIKVITGVRSFFSSLSSVPLYVYTTVSLAVHLLEDIWVFSTWGLLQIKLLLCISFCDISLPIVSIYAQSTIANWMGSVCLALWQTTKLFSRGLNHVVVPTAIYERSSFPVFLPVFGIVTIFYFSCSSRCSFNWHFFTG